MSCSHNITIRNFVVCFVISPFILCICIEQIGTLLKDLKVKNYLFHSIERSIMEMILVPDTSSKDTWDSIRESYQVSTKIKCAQFQASSKQGIYGS